MNSAEKLKIQKDNSEQKKCTRKLSKSQTKAIQTPIWGVSKTEMITSYLTKKKIAERWVEYTKELYNDNREPIATVYNINWAEHLKEEVENIIHLMKNGKATGPDDLPAEALKSLDEHNIDIITTLWNIIYDTWYIPTEMKQSTFIPIPKKQKAQDCTEYRTLSIMSHVTKLLLKIIQVRITAKINKEVSELQSGFRSGMGTREGIFNLRSICKRALKQAKKYTYVLLTTLKYLIE